MLSNAELLFLDLVANHSLLWQVQKCLSSKQPHRSDGSSAEGHILPLLFLLLLYHSMKTSPAYLQSNQVRKTSLPVVNLMILLGVIFSRVSAQIIREQSRSYVTAKESKTDMV